MKKRDVIACANIQMPFKFLFSVMEFLSVGSVGSICFQTSVTFNPANNDGRTEPPDKRLIAFMLNEGPPSVVLSRSSVGPQ